MQRIMVEQFKVMRHIWEKSDNGLDHTEIWLGAIGSFTLVNIMIVRNAIELSSEIHGIIKVSLPYVHQILYQMKALVINILELSYVNTSKTHEGGLDNVEYDQSECVVYLISGLL